MRLVTIVLGILCTLATGAAVLVVRSGSVSSILHVTNVAPSGSDSQSLVGSVAGKVGLPQDGVVTYNLLNFEKTTSVNVPIAVRFLSWGSPFPTATVLSNRSLGATTLLVLEPTDVNLAGIAAGRDDAYLIAFATAERHLGIPIMLSFAPEANGDWYQWGAHHITPSLFIDMWRHVHDVIQKNADSPITWLWQMNVQWPGSEAMSLLWPGRDYVNEVGIDGQLKSSGTTFASVFNPSIAQIRKITSDPIIISEVSVQVGPDAPKLITSLYIGACQEHLVGAVLFDVHKEWQIDADAQAVAAFRRAVTAKCRG